MGNERDKTMHDMVVRQGYVPETCKLPGELVFRLVKDQTDPCVGCEEDRTVCKGRAKVKP